MRRWKVGKVWRRVILLLIATALALPLLYALDFVYVATDNEADYAVPADVIIVLGCPSYEGNVISTTFSACVRARAHHAAELYHRGIAAHIIPTGGFTGPLPSEAGAMAQVLQADGVPPSAIILEEQARDTVGNLRYSRDIMRANNWNTAVLVTDPHHIKRAAFIARDAGLTVYTSPAVKSPAWHNPDARRESLLRETRYLMTYQFGRLQTGPP